MFLFKNMVNNPYPYESQIVSKYSAIENYFAHADKIKMVVITSIAWDLTPTTIVRETTYLTIIKT